MRDKCHAKLSSPFLVILCVLAATGPALCQTLTQDLPWYGTVQCDLSVQTSNYAHQETQTWTVAGGAPTVQGVIPATWSVSGQGSAQRLVNLQTANWKTDVAPISAPLRVFVRASDNRLIIKPWHTQLLAAGTTTGTRVSARGQVAVQYSASEWLFPAIEDVANSMNVSGSGTVPVATSSLPLAPPGTTGTAVCKWQLSHVQHTLPGTPPAAIAAGVPPVARVVTTPARPPAGTPASTPASSNTQTPAASAGLDANSWHGDNNACQRRARCKQSSDQPGPAGHDFQRRRDVEFCAGHQRGSISSSELSDKRERGGEHRHDCSAGRDHVYIVDLRTKPDGHIHRRASARGLPRGPGTVRRNMHRPEF